MKMVEITYNLYEDSLVSEIIMAKRTADKNGFDDVILAFEKREIPLEIDDNYLVAKDSRGNWYVSIAPEDFNSKHLELIIRKNPNILDDNLIRAVIESIKTD